MRPLGAFCAGDIPLLAPWLQTFRGRKIVLVPHMDEEQIACARCLYRSKRSRLEIPLRPDGTCGKCAGGVTSCYPGEDAIAKLYAALADLRADTNRVELFDWPRLLGALDTTLDTFRQSGRSDLNDLIRQDLPGGPLIPFTQLVSLWRAMVETP
jgi:hypothetical protein